MLCRWKHIHDMHDIYLCFTILLVFYLEGRIVDRNALSFFRLRQRLGEIEMCEKRKYQQM